jgi:hypothetical protein
MTWLKSDRGNCFTEAVCKKVSSNAVVYNFVAMIDGFSMGRFTILGGSMVQA